MVGGLGRFRDHFAEMTDRYVLIGGAACDLIMDEAGLEFRATKDLDIVLTIDADDAEFQRLFWAFVEAGGYSRRETAAGRPQFYRFQNPSAAGFPVMLELFSREPDTVTVAAGSHLTPIPGDGDVSSLSAILLDDEYYEWIQAGRRLTQGVSIVGPEHLIPLKARAWLDLTDRREAGMNVDSRVIKKHKNDVFRLFGVLDPTFDLGPPPRIIADMGEFTERMASEAVDLRALRMGEVTADSVLAVLRSFYLVS